MTACRSEGCDRPARAKGYCDSHYHAWRTTGREPSGPVNEKFGTGRRGPQEPKDEMVRLATEERLNAAEIALRLGTTRQAVRHVVCGAGVVLASIAAERFADEAYARRLSQLQRRVDRGRKCVVCTAWVLRGGTHRTCSVECEQERGRIIVAMAADGQTYSEIGARVGMVPGQVGDFLRSHGAQRTSRLSQAETQRIIDLYRDAPSVASVARTVGRSGPSVRRVLVRAGLIERRYPCGTLAGYNLDGCLCTDCCAANTLALRDGRRRERDQRERMTGRV